MGVQVPCRVHAKVPQEVAVWANQAALGQCIPQACPAQGMPNRGRALEPDHVHMLISIPPKYSVSEVIGYLKGKSSIWIAQNVERKLRNFLGHKFWARGYFVSTIGRDEETIRAYIRNQEMADKAAGSVATKARVLMKSQFLSQDPL
jgi:putative transposase